MRLPLRLLALLFGVVSARSEELELLWETAGLVAPESVVFDATRKHYYVSNMGSYGQGAVEGDGFLSRLDEAGRVLELRWIAGLENPKGLALRGETLFVGDDNGLLQISVPDGRVVQRHTSTGGVGDFNDCTIDAAGNVYVYSGSQSVVYRLHNGTLEPWVNVDRAQMGGLNGLLAEPDRLLLGGWSVRDKDGTERLGHLSFVRLDTREFGRLGSESICHIDGIEADGAGGYTVTDWVTGGLYQVSGTGIPRLIAALPPGTADHTYRADTRTLVMPLMKDNAVRAYRWSPPQEPAR